MVVSLATIVITMFVLLGSGLYLGLALAGTGIIGIELLSHMGRAIGATLYNNLNSYVLSAVTFYVFLGELMIRSGLSNKLYDGVSRWTRIIPGSLLHSNVVACAIFAAISGSSVATAATIGIVAYPEQKKRGYEGKIITGSLAAAGTLGPLIPPSILMIVYGAYVQASVGKLFAGGIVPGIILSIFYMIYIALAVMRNRSLAPGTEKITRRYFIEALTGFKEVWPSFLIIALIIGSIYGGLMTPTDAAAAGAVLTLLLGSTVGNLNFRLIREAAIAAARTMSMVFLLYVGACLLGAALGFSRLPAFLAQMVADLHLSPTVIWMAVVALYLVLGCFMESLAMLLITLPVTYPLVVQLGGYDPIWYGVQLVVLCEIGMVTPPFGMNLFVIQGITKSAGSEVELSYIVRGVMPFLVCMMIGLVLFSVWPEIILFLPNRMLGR